MKQYSPGRWLGAYYTQLQYTASYMTFVNFAMIAVNLWIVAKKELLNYIPWLSFPLFVTIALLLLFVVIPLLDYVFMLKSRIQYQNQQACLHDNPVIERLDNMEKLMRRLNARKHRNSRAKPA